jgi:hypothetical protein
MVQHDAAVFNTTLVTLRVKAWFVETQGVLWPLQYHHSYIKSIQAQRKILHEVASQIRQYAGIDWVSSSTSISHNLSIFASPPYGMLLRKYEIGYFRGVERYNTLLSAWWPEPNTASHSSPSFRQSKRCCLPKPALDRMGHRWDRPYIPNVP